MHRASSLWALILKVLLIKSQVINYIGNGGFEKCVNCSITPYIIQPNYWTAIDSTSFGFVFCSSIQPILNLPNIAGGYQFARSGNNIIGSTVYCHTNTCAGVQGRMYPRNRLRQTLKLNKTYCVKFYVNCGNANTVGIESYGMFLGDVMLDTINYCQILLSYLNPQVENNNGFITDTLGWTMVTGTFVANGNEKYAILGNFKSNISTNTVIVNSGLLPLLATDAFYDDVSLIELDLPAFAGRDTNFIPGDSIFLGREPDVGIDEACIWYKLPGSTPIDTIAGFWIKPTNTCTYVVRQEICGLVKWDTVIVRLDAVGLEEHNLFPNEITLLPNPTAGEFTIQSAREMQYISIEDVSGRVIYENKTPPNTTQILIQTELSDGLYFVRVLDALGGEQRKRLVVCH